MPWKPRFCVFIEEELFWIVNRKEEENQSQLLFTTFSSSAFAFVYLFFPSQSITSNWSVERERQEQRTAVFKKRNEEEFTGNKSHVRAHTVGYISIGMYTDETDSPMLGLFATCSITICWYSTRIERLESAFSHALLLWFHLTAFIKKRNCFITIRRISTIHHRRMLFVVYWSSVIRCTAQKTGFSSVKIPISSVEMFIRSFTTRHHACVSERRHRSTESSWSQTLTWSNRPMLSSCPSFSMTFHWWWYFRYRNSYNHWSRLVPPN